MAEPATKKLHERELGELTFVAGQSSMLPGGLPRNYSLDRLKFRLTMALSRAAGATGGAPKDISGAQVVDRIEVRKNGREVLKSIDFETLVRLNQLRYGALPNYEFGTTWDDYDAQTNKGFIIDAVIDFGMWGGLQRFDTLLDTTWRGGISTLDLVVFWGQLNNVMTPAYDPASGGVTADTTPVLSIATEEYIDPDALPGQYVENREYQAAKIDVSASNSKLQHRFNIGNRFRSFVIKTHSDGVQRNDIVNNIKIMSGSNVYMNRKGLSLREENRMLCQLESMPVGYYLLEFCKDGHLTRSINTVGLSDLTCEMDVTKQGTNCVIDIYPVELVPVPVTILNK